MTSPPEGDRCYATAIRILQYRFNSEAELRRKLRAKRFESAEIDATIRRLHEERWLDDERFAGAFVRTRTQKRVGPLRIRRELQAAGVASDAAEQAIAANCDAEAEREALCALRDKRSRALARRHGAEFLTTPAGRNKVASYLLKQGYDAALVYEALKEIPGADHQPDS